MIFHLFVTDLDVLSLLDGESSQQCVQHWVNTLSNVLQQKTVSIGHRSLNEVKVSARTILSYKVIPMHLSSFLYIALNLQRNIWIYSTFIAYQYTYTCTCMYVILVQWKFLLLRKLHDI